MTSEPETDGEEWGDRPDEIAAADGEPRAVLDDRPVCVDLFAGIGGLALGFERAGFQTGAVVEWDAAASRVLAARFPNAARFSDVRNVDGDAVRRALGGRRVDVLTGGFPCTDVSVAGRRAGVAGERTGLYAEFVRLAAELDPTWVVWENVPGLLSSRDAENPHARAGDDLGLVLGDFTGFRPDTPDGGWRGSGLCAGPRGSLAWRVLDSRFFGVAQRRRRVFAVLRSGDRAAPAAVLLEPPGVRRDPAARVPSWQGVAAAAVGAAVGGREVGTDRGGAGAARPAVAHAVTAGGSGAGRPRDAEGNLVAWAPEVANPLNAPSTGGQRMDLEGMTYVPTVAPPLLSGPASEASHGKRSGDDRGALVAQGLHEYPDGNYGLEDWAPPPIVNQRAKVLAPNGDTDEADEYAPSADVRRAIENMAVAFSEGRTGQAVSDVAPTVQATRPGDSSHRQQAVVTYRKSRRPMTTADDETWVADDQTNTLNTFDNAGDVRATELVVQARQTTWQIEPETGQGANLKARPADLSPALTATDLSASTDRGARVASAAVRRLTPGECETLQAFPKGWTDVPDAQGRPASDSARYKQLGNAVTVNVAEWIACRIRDWDDGLIR